MLVKSPDPSASVLLFTWQVHWVSFLELALQVGVLAWYLAGARRVAARGRRWSLFRTACFCTGLLVIAYATEGGIAHYQASNFTVHVVQLMLLIDVGPPLLAMGAPITLALQSSSRKTTARLLKALHSWPARAITQPLVALVIAMVVMFVYLLTPLYRLSEEHPLLLACVDLIFVLAGFVLWTLIVARDGLPRHLGFGMRFVLVFLLVPLNLALGLAVANTTAPLYPAGNTLADTQSGGDVLLGLAEVFIAAVLALMFVEWAREEERNAVRADRQLDAALAIARETTGPGPGADDG
jgi:cytochrome c oxidase assembly factor CtaG